MLPVFAIADKGDLGAEAAATEGGAPHPRIRRVAVNLLSSCCPLSKIREDFEDAKVMSNEIRNYTEVLGVASLGTKIISTDLQVDNRGREMRARTTSSWQRTWMEEYSCNLSCESCRALLNRRKRGGDELTAIATVAPTQEDW